MGNLIIVGEPWGWEYPKNNKNNFEKYINIGKWGTMYCRAHCIPLEEDNDI